MRRARIKAVATVPVRRKAVQDGATATAEESNKETNTTESNIEENTPKPVENLDAAKPVKIIETPKPIKETDVIKEKKQTDPSSASTDASIPTASIPCQIKQTDLLDQKKQTDTTYSIKKIDTKKQTIVTDHEKLKKNDDVSNFKNISNEISGNEKETNKSSEVSDVNKPESKNNIPDVIKNELLTRADKSPAYEGSPIKLIPNRSCFMRPTPRLDGGSRIRRNSMQGSGASASESEDDSKRASSVASNRIRNEVSSWGRNLVMIPKEEKEKKKRRMVVSESARKLAEARREFILKHENKTPDKAKLTMYDLIYYNPTTNPMKQKPSTRKLSICSIPDKNVEDKPEEDADEPSAMPVPQVKVGPNGQLIIDEQSLVIDQYKAQENIDRSEIIVDEDTTGNGFYKRRSKSKEWSKWETVKFYKALNTYGTDFLLMQSIFPKRTRQELKLKYKKEEKINGNLIEKALQYQEFDTEALEKDLASVEENEQQESQKVKVKKNNDCPLPRKRKRCKIITDEVDGNEQVNRNELLDHDYCNDQSSDENVRITITKKVRKYKRKKKNSIEKIRSDNDEDNSDSAPEVYKAKPTRSGRTSKKNKKILNTVRESLR